VWLSRKKGDGRLIKVQSLIDYVAISGTMERNVLEVGHP